MKNHLVAVAAAVPPIHVGDVRYNTERIIEEIQKQKDCGVIVFPELSITGYTCADLFESDLLLEESEKVHSENSGKLARQIPSMAKPRRASRTTYLFFCITAANFVNICYF